MRVLPTLLALVAALTLVGCAVTPEPTADAQATPSQPAAPATGTPAGSDAKAAGWPTDVTIHRNAKGEVECPVMKVGMANPEDALEHVDHEGKRYYFCCAACPGKFKENPALYAKK